MEIDNSNISFNFEIFKGCSDVVLSSIKGFRLSALKRTVEDVTVSLDRSLPFQPASTGILRDKVVVISGASRGIGEAIAVRCAREGAKVCVLARSQYNNDYRRVGTIHEVVGKINAAGGQGLAIATDLTKEKDILRAVKTIVDHFGGIDVLVNNASVLFNVPTPQLSQNHFDVLLGTGMLHIAFQPSTPT